MSMAIFSPKLPSNFPLSPSHSTPKTHLTQKPYLSLRPSYKKLQSHLLASADDNGSSVTASVTTIQDEVPVSADVSVGSNGSQPETTKKEEAKAEAEAEPVLFAEKIVGNFEDVKWVGGTWDLKQFSTKNGQTDWDAVIDAEVKRRKWMQDNPESTNNEQPIFFDTSIIPWWAWMKRFHLPEAELLNGRAAMVGFFMAYFVDSLTGVGLVDQMGNFFCKTLLFVAVAGVLLIRKNEDVDTIKKLLEETTFYDKQWQATWQDDKTKNDV